MLVQKMIGMFKNNKKGFCKESIDNLTKYWPGGSYLVLRIKPMVPRGRLINAIGYKYTTRKVLYFIVTVNARRTTAGINYLSKYLELFYNAEI